MIKSILRYEQKHTKVKVWLPDNTGLEYKLSVRVFRKFTKTVLYYVNDILTHSPITFQEYYLDILKKYYNTKDCRLILNDEFLNQIKNVVNEYVEKNKEKIIVGFKKEGTLSESQLFSIFKVSFYLKMYSFFLYTSISLLEEEQKILFKKITTELQENGVDKYLFDFIKLKFLAKANNSFWQWISTVKFQDIFYYISNTYFIIISQILLQLMIGYNPIAYIKTIVESTIYFLVTDIYLDEVKYIENESKKLRYVKSYSLIEKHVIKNAYEHIVKTVKEYYANQYQVVTNTLKGKNIKPIYNFITLPLITKITRSSYIYFYTLKEQHYLNLYIGIILDYIFPQLTRLRKITRAYCIPKQKNRISTNMYESISSLYNISHPLQSIFKETKCFDNVLKNILMYDYWDIFTQQKIENNAPQKLVEELKLYYTNFILDNKYNLIFDSFKKDGFEIPSTSSTVLSNFLLGKKI